MGLFGRFRAKRDETAALYAAVVARARQPHWFLDGAVADTVDGRFDMIAAVLAMVMLRLESNPAGVPAATHLSEAFVDDMDPQLREIGIGDRVMPRWVRVHQSACRMAFSPLLRTVHSSQTSGTIATRKLPAISEQVPV